MVEEQQLMMVTTRKANADPIDTKDNLQTSEFIRELNTAILPSYLKDLYANFNLPSRLMIMNTIKEQKLAEANTVRSYENMANGKLHNNIKDNY